MNNNKNIFLKSELSNQEQDQETSKFHIIPVPLEKTVSYGKGTSKGPQSIIYASNELERFTGKSEPCSEGIFTHPKLDCNMPLKDIMSNIGNLTKEVSSKNKIPITLGGEHSVTYGAVNGIFDGLKLKKRNRNYSNWCSCRFKKKLWKSKILTCKRDVPFRKREI